MAVSKSTAISNTLNLIRLRMKTSPRIAYRSTAIPYEDSLLESENRRFMNNREKFVFKDDQARNTTSKEKKRTSQKAENAQSSQISNNDTQSTDKPLIEACHVSLNLSSNDFNQIKDMSLPLNSVRSFMVKDLWIRWKELQTKYRPIWKLGVLAASHELTNNADNNLPTLPNSKLNPYHLKPIYKHLKGFINPPLDTHSYSNQANLLAKELFQNAIRNGYIYSTYNIAYINVRQQAEVTSKTAKRIASAYARLTKPTQLISNVSKYPAPLHTGHFKLPINIVSIKDPNAVIFRSMTYIKRLELLPGISAFKILPSHGLYDKITKDMRVVHPLSVDNFPIENPDQFQSLELKSSPLKLIPIVTLTESQDSELRNSSSNDPNSTFSKSLSIALPTPYITPVFAGNDEVDFRLARMLQFKVQQAIDVNGQVNFGPFMSNFLPYVRTVVDETTNEKSFFFDYKVQQAPSVEQGSQLSTQTLELHKGLASIPIPAANALIYDLLRQKLIPCNPETEYFPVDPRLVPGLVEPVISQEWRVNVKKVLHNTQLAQYLGKELRGPVKDELEKVVGAPPKGNLNAVVTKNQIEVMKDFKITYTAKNGPGYIKSLYGLTNSHLPISDSRHTEERFFKMSGLRSNVNLHEWVIPVITSVLNWVSSSTEFSQPPIVITEDDGDVKKQLLTLMSLFSPTVEPTMTPQNMSGIQSSETATSRLLKNRPILDSVVIGQPIYGPRDMNLSRTWTLKALKYFRAGADVLDIVPKVLEIPGSQVYTQEKIKEQGIRYTFKSFDTLRFLMIDSLNPSPTNENDNQWNNIICDDAQGVFSAFYYLRDSRHKFAQQLFYRKDEPITPYKTLSEREYYELALPYESYMLYLLKETTANVTELMNQKQFYEAKQLVDSIILKTSGYYLPALISDLLDHKTLPMSRLLVARSIYEKVIKTVCVLAYPFYPFVSQHVYEFFERGSSNDANMGYGQSVALHKLQTDAYSDNVFEPRNEESNEIQHAQKTENTNDHITRFLGGYQLTKERDYLPGNIMMKIVDQIELAVTQGLVPRERLRAYITLAINDKNPSAQTKSSPANKTSSPSNRLQQLFGYSNRTDVNKYVTILIKRMLRVKRVDLSVNPAVYNSGRVATRKVYPGLYLQIFDDNNWLTKEEFEKEKEYLEEYILGKKPEPTDT